MLQDSVVDGAAQGLEIAGSSVSGGQLFHEGKIVDQRRVLALQCLLQLEGDVAGTSEEGASLELRVDEDRDRQVMDGGSVASIGYSQPTDKAPVCL